MGKGKRLREQRKLIKEAPIEYTRELSSKWFYIIRYIAMATMLIDHLGAVLVLLDKIDLDLYFSFRIIGRMAFPLFAFGLVETFFHTKRWGKHLLMLGILAVITEPIYDMTLVNSEPFKFTGQSLSSQNTVATMFLGFLLMMIWESNWEEKLTNTPLSKFKRVVKFEMFFWKVLLLAAAMKLSSFFLFDYEWIGIMLIFLFYFARKRKFKRIWQFIAILCFFIAMPEPHLYYSMILLCLIPIYLGEAKHKKDETSMLSKIITSKPSKMICRYFYPAHFIVLLALRLILIKR